MLHIWECVSFCLVVRVEAEGTGSVKHILNENETNFLRSSEKKLCYIVLTTCSDTELTIHSDFCDTVILCCQWESRNQNLMLIYPHNPPVMVAQGERGVHLNLKWSLWWRSLLKSMMIKWREHLLCAPTYGLPHIVVSHLLSRTL